MLALLSSAFADDAAYERRLRQAGSPSEILDILRESDREDPEVEGALLDAEDAATDAERKTLAERARTIYFLGTEAGGVKADDDASRRARQIKRNRLYRDEMEEQANWLGRALERLRNLKFDPPDVRPPNAPDLNFGRFVIPLVWAFLGAGVLLLLYLAARHLRWRRTLERKAKALLEEDEPERTKEEWLELADRLESEGRFREAVRCLYLACLLRFDEARVARFDRGQTNWEHLARIEASSLRPPSIDFRSATQRFDIVWYGRRVRGAVDVEEFRQVYQSLSAALRAEAA